MEERQMVCYPRSGDFSLRSSVYRVLKLFFPFFKPFFSIQFNLLSIVKTNFQEFQ